MSKTEKDLKHSMYFALPVPFKTYYDRNKVYSLSMQIF